MADETVVNVETHMEPEPFLNFVGQRILDHKGANIYVILECRDGAFETLSSVPSGPWQRGMLETALDILRDRNKPTHHAAIAIPMTPDDQGTVN